MGATYKLKRKKADGTLEDVILQGVITDLGEQEDNALAEQAIINLLKPTSVQTGGYLYTYHTTCRNDAVMAICCKREQSIKITYISSNDGTVRYSSYDIETEELQSECWRQMFSANPFFESVSISENTDQSQCNNQINAQGFYINLTNEFGNSYLSFNINDGIELVQYDGTSLVLNGGYFSVGDSDENSLIITPSAITHNDNEYQFPNKSGTLAVTEDIPSVGNGTITIKQAGTTKGTFTINQSGDTTIELGDAYVIQAHTTTDANYPLLFKLASGITTTGNTTNSTRYANNIYVNPATGTVYATTFNGALKGNADTATNADKLGNLSASQYATKQDIDELTQLADIRSIDTWFNEPQFTSTDEGITWSEQAVMYDGDDSQIWEGWIDHRVPLVAGDNVTFEVQNNQVKVNATGGGGSNGIRKIATLGEGGIKATASTDGAYFRIVGNVSGAAEFLVHSKTITLNSSYSYFISIEGMLIFHQTNDGRAVWNVMVVTQPIGGTPSHYAFYVTTTDADGIQIGDDLGEGSYSGIVCE